MRLSLPLPAALLAVALVGGGLAAPLAASAAGPARVQASGGATLGHDRIGVRRGDTWLLRDDLSGGPARTYTEQSAGWQPVAGDLDGDGTASLSLFRDGVWLLRDAEGGPSRTVRFGLRGDRPVVGDWDGDGVDTLGLFRAGRWFLRASNATSATYRTFGYGVSGDLPVVGDWDADGDTDIAVTRGATWYQRDAASPGPSSRQFAFGRAGDLPVAGDWDHDGRDTPGLFRQGTWFFKVGNGFGGYQTTSFGRSGDRPVVRRTPGLAPGVTHRVLRSDASTVHLSTVELAASSTPDAVLSGGTLGGVEATTSMARRTGAPVAINADYFLSNGRPVHAMAADGRLLQTPQLLGRAFGLDATGTQVRMGYPDTRVEVQGAASASPTVVSRWNAGEPVNGQLAGHTAVAAGVDAPPPDRCYTGGALGSPTVRPDGAVETTFTPTGNRCYGPSPYVGPGAAVLTADPLTSGEAFLRSLTVGTAFPVTSYLGFPGSVDVLGGNPLLLRDGVPQSQDHTGSGAFFERQPRTAVGVTGDGRLLLVVVDGRQGSYSAGMTLGELAQLMSQLGARDAINLDGGGSSTMVVNGLIANRPSGGRERAVANALVVLPGGDPGQADLRIAATPGTTTPPRSSLRAAALPPQGVSVDPSAAFAAAAADPGSIGGLADALAAEGAPLPVGLRQADAAYDRTR